MSRPAAPSAIETRDLLAAYRDRVALADVSLSLRGGERVALIGPNGSGKSTLLRCLTGLLRPRRGTVLLNGIPVEEMGRPAIARRVAVVPQQVTLPFAMRVEEVVALGRIPHEDPLLGLRDDDRRAVARAIERVGLEALVGRDARELSLGERQLVLLAAALAQETPVLLLDEPTVHLDLGHQVAIMELLRDLNERDGITVLAVLHDLHLASHFFPRVAALWRGGLVADGPPSRVLTEELVRRVFDVEPSAVPLRFAQPPLAAQEAGTVAPEPGAG